MSKNKPRVNIGLPVFNGENFLKEALNSILAQTFTDFELIISDNASTDRTQEICEAYAAKDERISYHRNERNLGAAMNYNRVFALASSEYFLWTAHDDLQAPEFLERCVEVLDREPNVVLCYPKSKLINGHGEVIGYYADNLNLRSAKPFERFRKFFDNPGLCHAIFGLIRTDTLKQTNLIGNFPRSDRNLLGELALYGELYEIPEYLFYRRDHSLASTKVHETENELAEWFDPSKKGKAVFPRWRRFFEYLKAIKKAPLGWPERIRCYIQVGRFVLLPKKWVGLAEDFFKGAILFHRNAKNLEK